MEGFDKMYRTSGPTANRLQAARLNTHGNRDDRTDDTKTKTG